MSLNPTQNPDHALAESFSVGICATGNAANIAPLLEIIEKEKIPRSYILDKIVIAASECSESSLEAIREVASRDPRIVLLEETKRSGKAAAINRIIKETSGNYLLMVNSDALPKSGSMSLLLEAIGKEGSIGMVSGNPIFKPKPGTTSAMLELMWNVHNDCSLILNHKNISNHCSDELMIIRRGALNELPAGLVNDGGFLANTASLRGYSIRFCEKALVNIDVPQRVVDVIIQRRRILFGHMQVRRLTGKVPKTAESLMFIAPILSLGVAVSVLARVPRLIKVIPVALVGEGLSLILAIRDTFATNRDKHTVWKRYAD